MRLKPKGGHGAHLAPPPKKKSGCFPQDFTVKIYKKIILSYQYIYPAQMCKG